MKATTVVATFFFGTVIMAAPGAISLKRSFIEADGSVDIGNPATVGTLKACVECPCDGFFGGCTCVKHGCCKNDCQWPHA